MNRSDGLIIDIRGFDSKLRRGLLFALVDKLVEMGSRDRIVVVCDHEPAGLGYQIDLRRETRGRFTFEYDQRSDGAWIAFISPIDPGSAKDSRQQPR